MFVINLALCSTVLRGIRVFGVQPDTTVLIIVSYAILRGDIEGAAVGFFAGLLQDIFFSGIIGTSALLGFILGFICGKPFKDFFPENYALPLILCGFGTLFFHTGYYFLTYLFQGETDFMFYFNRKILPVSIYTVAISVPVYRVIYFINSKLEAGEKPRRRFYK
jgi:rod shape-determining protein MreD